MKVFKYYCLAGLLGLSLTSCEDMNLEPKGFYDEATIFGNEYGVQKYFATIYNEMPVEDFVYNASSGYRYGNYWDAVKNSLASVACETTGWITVHGGGFGYWPYGRIRDINTFIQNFPNYASNFSEAQANELIAEARFLRAYYYFGLVKRYGGVPIVDKVLDPTAPTEELQQPRNTEYDCWMFIHDDLDFAMKNMAETSDLGRANRYAAAALMSRAMLYAGSIAKYGGYTGFTGEVVDLGLVGIPADKAEQFFQYAYDACKMVKEGGYTLYRDDADKERGYVDLFIKDTQEDILIRQYGPNTTTPFNAHLSHSWDSSVLPNDKIMSPDLESVMYPTWDLVQLFEMPAITDADGKPIRFNTREELWQSPEMEPRLKAIVFFHGMTEEASGEKFDILAGLFKEFPGTAEEAIQQDPNNPYMQEHYVRPESKDATYEGIKITGAHGWNGSSGPANNARTGMFVRKYVDYRANADERGLYKSSQSWKVFRYGEILCNWAEAAYELGLLRNDDALKQEAIGYINELRDRAGAHPYTYVADPADVGTAEFGIPIDENLQYIRDERARELAFESHRWWDIRRWRIADKMFQNHHPQGLLPFYVQDEDKYIYLNHWEMDGMRSYNFGKSAYYEPIPGGEISKNPNLYPQNPLY